VVADADWIELKRHPSTAAEAVGGVQVSLNRAAGGELLIRYRLEGEISRIRIPPPSVPQIGKELWRHTCFEVFIAVDGQVAYHEFNFAPSREWTVYALRAYRDGVPLMDQMMRPDIAVRSDGSRFELDGVVRLNLLSAIHPGALLRVGLSAVIEASDGISYWALSHPGSKPDFHNAEAFGLVLEPSDSDG